MIRSSLGKTEVGAGERGVLETGKEMLWVKALGRPGERPLWKAGWGWGDGEGWRR